MIYSGEVFCMLLNIFFLILHISGSGSFPHPLTAAQEREYLKKYAEGDSSARAALIEHNLRLVAHIAKKYFQSPTGALQPEDQDDLISIGSLGLIKAIDSFNCEKNTRLATYAAKCIENEILMYFRSRKKTANDISINEEIDSDKDGNTLSLVDIIAEDNSILDTVCSKIRVEQLTDAINTVLDERERQIIKLRYGLSEPPLTQKETAERLNISRSYVSRLEKKALDELKKHIDK